MPLLPITSYCIPFKVPGSQRDRQILHYFCVQGSSDISGFLTSDFWSDVVLRESHQDSAVRQALVAMSSLHLDYVTSDPARAQVASVETLDHYGRAIRTIRKRLAQESTDSIKFALISCIILYCCESTLGDQDAALQHLGNGLKLFKSFTSNAKKGGNDDIKQLTTMFERLDVQASFFQDDRVPILSLPDWKIHKADYEALVPEKGFFTLQEAHESLVKLQAWIYSFVNTNIDVDKASADLPNSEILDEKEALVQGFNSWNHAVDTFKLMKQHDEQVIYGLGVLLVQSYTCEMILQSKFPANEQVFGASPNPAAHRILDLTEELLEYTTKINSSSRATGTTRRNFSLESGIVAPLFALALKCSDESVTTRAAQMLSSSYRREGLYDAQTMAQILAQLRRSRDCEKSVKVEPGSNGAPLNALEYHIPSTYEGGGIDKLLASMSI